MTSPRVLFNIFHETGHALNATLKPDLISDSKEFAEVFSPVWSRIDKSLPSLPSVQAIGGLGTQELIKDEVRP
ncbi:hypothetical protein BH10CYA1_BH10CYA1_03600 [soil metagenome]